MKTMNTVIGLFVSALISQGAWAQTSAPTSESPTQKREELIQKREDNQQKRIQEGEKSGQLTQGEDKKLENQQARIKKMEEKAAADGKISGQEMKKIEKAQNHASNDIKRKKHNKKHQ